MSHRATPERSCIITGETHPREALLRFALSPDGQVVFDVKANLPGRGVWLVPSKVHLQTAITKQAFSRGFKQKVKAEEALLEQTEAAITQRFLNFMQRAMQSREMVSGFEKCASALRLGEGRVLMHVSDAAEDGARKLDKLAAQQEQPKCESYRILPRAVVGEALNMENPTHFVCKNAGLAKHLQHFAAMRARFLASDTV